jgi:hypothetical protein
MAMEVQFSGLVPTTRTINLSDDDLATLHQIVVDYFLSILPYTELTDRSCKYDSARTAMRDFALKYNVDPSHADSLVSFYAAVLQQPKNDG